MTIVPIKESSSLPQSPELESASANKPVVQPTENTPPDRFESGGPSLEEVERGLKRSQS